MLIILSQRIDTESDYSDKVFEIYHFPSAYKNRIHEGDIFVYYQGNRYVKEQRYYYGVGTVGKITTFDEENYFASLLNVQQFKSTVSIYLPDGKYVETLGYETVRKSPTPPWQSSVRPLSQEAFDYILHKGGVTMSASSPIDILKEQMKESIRSFYLEDNVKALIEIKKISSNLIQALHLEKEPAVNDNVEKNRNDNNNGYLQSKTQDVL